MAPQNRKINKYLTCFYCNRKSSTRYDGRMRQFECNNCQASNHLNSNGNITDPPVAKTTNESAAAQFAIHPSSASKLFPDTVFCKRCLQNQHLFIASLAQFLPEDPNDPEYIRREKGYHKFYRGLMRRYPQVCAECEPKVRKELDKAAYTAKTDHLRRMLDRSAETRIITTKSTVNYIQKAGKWLWFASLLLQILWHVSLIHQAVIEKHDGTTTPNKWTSLFLRAFSPLSGYLPTPLRIAKLSFWSSVLSFWWNPKWVETWRGFNRHLIGFDHYYQLQALLLVLKLPGYRDMSLLPGTHQSRLVVQITANASMALLILWLYRVTRKSIRVDHTPLWTPKASSIGATPARTSGVPSQPLESQEDSTKSMADILDEIMNAPVANTQSRYQTRSKTQLQPQPGLYMLKSSSSERSEYMPSIPEKGTHNQPTEFSFGLSEDMPLITQKNSHNPATSLSNLNPFKDLPSQRPPSAGLGFDDLSLSDSPRRRTRQMADYSPNMEWSPTQSKYRAFSTYKPGHSESRKFGETPTHERAGAFWAKVPPAPTTPAQRIFNPPNAPRIRTTPQTTVKDTVSFQGNKSPVFSKPPANAPPETIFANPKFQPPQPRDERDSLAEHFNKSFKLDQDPLDEHGVEFQDRLKQVASRAKFGVGTLATGLIFLAGGLLLAALAWVYVSPPLSIVPAIRV
ncbi:hypothetical protein VPNG_09431 [Cytospora leucostoma]|uniref:Ima1 N-terminal domain-containing protein n=1 Tax=Cytospora leucostoma TaxID=1230097 RepID=A0A423VQ59_9PEZI|nr:hypothetical protein VPNG_09431 [Cytospora leucostoma]